MWLYLYFWDACQRSYGIYLQIHASVSTWDWKSHFLTYGLKFKFLLWLNITILFGEYFWFYFHKNPDVSRLSGQKIQENHENEKKVWGFITVQWLFEYVIWIKIMLVRDQLKLCAKFRDITHSRINNNHQWNWPNFTFVRYWFPPPLTLCTEV